MENIYFDLDQDEKVCPLIIGDNITYYDELDDEDFEEQYIDKDYQDFLIYQFEIDYYSNEE